jgi:Ser/Thr protein kinase RdoA (MazF antagonist)
MAGASNVVWHVAASTGDYVVKELPAENSESLAKAAAFERAVFDADVVAVAEPCPDDSGDYIRLLTGSRDLVAAVRVHRYVPGQPPRRPADHHLVERAGETLAAIQSFGACRPFDGPARPLGQSADERLVERFRRRWPDLNVDQVWAEQILFDADSIVSAGQLSGGTPVFSHIDHKPDNCLVAEQDALLVLDWDEAGPCDPRIEAVESGLRWAWTSAGEPDADLFTCFVHGYQHGGQPFPPLRERDWAKWIAGLASWFEFKARCSLDEWPAVATPPREAAAMAIDALNGLSTTLQQTPRWTAAINERL